MLLLIVACVGLDPHTSAVRTGAPERDTAAEPDSGDSGEGNEGSESADTSDTGGAVDSADTSVAIPADQQVCYPGAAEDYSACLDLVEWSSDWGSDYAYPDPYAGSPQYAAPVRFVDLSSVDSTLSIAPNFVLSEVMSASKGRYGLFQVHAVESLQVLRDASGGALSVTSAYRNPSYNESVGGVSSSRHIYGDGVDLVSDVWDLDGLAEGCLGAGAAYTQIYSDGHVHCDWRDNDLDPAFYDAAGATVRAPRPVVVAEIRVEGGRLRAPATGFDEGEPLRQWRAFDREGKLLVTATGEEFSAPAGAVEVVVRVGGVLERRLRVDGGASRF